MSTVHASEIVSVWFEDGLPTRLVWRGTRYLATETPTPLHEPIDDAALTHPAHRIVGWRFQGRSVSDGDNRVFNVHQIGDTRWELTGAYV